jgi:hypothetical protein
MQGEVWMVCPGEAQIFSTRLKYCFWGTFSSRPFSSFKVAFVLLNKSQSFLVLLYLFLALELAELHVDEVSLSGHILSVCVAMLRDSEAFVSIFLQ